MELKEGTLVYKNKTRLLYATAVVLKTKGSGKNKNQEALTQKHPLA
jgi:hypothetical protein